MKYLFGPVPSRRLGMSLGVDLVPYKYCTMNCIYCEVGSTTNLEIERAEYVPTDKVISELDDYLSSNPALDYITFSGSGEPTLHSKIGSIIEFLKTKYPQYKIALLTNSTLLSDKQLREELCPIDLILPSLDAVSKDIFEKINRPHPKLKPKNIIAGLKAFHHECKATMWLEIFIIPTLNDHEDEIRKLKEAAFEISPDKVQINALDRPGAEDWVKKSDYHTLEKIRDSFLPMDTEIIASKPQQKKIKSDHATIEETILNTIRRRPCTIEDLVSITGYDKELIRKKLDLLKRHNQITLSRQDRGDFYMILH